jgi:hypothetical protein
MKSKMQNINCINAPIANRRERENIFNNICRYSKNFYYLRAFKTSLLYLCVKLFL